MHCQGMAVLVGRTTTGPGSPSTWSLWSPPARGGRYPPRPWPKSPARGRRRNAGTGRRRSRLNDGSRRDIPYAEANVVFRAMRRMAGSRPVSWLYARILSAIDPAVSRISGRRMTFVRLVSGLPVLLLTPTGARTGAKRTQPLLYLREGDDLVVIGSNWGQAHNPAWYYNLRANPYAEVALSGVIALHGQMSDVQSPVNFAINRTFSPWRVGLDRDRYGDDNLIGGRCQLLGGPPGAHPSARRTACHLARRCGTWRLAPARLPVQHQARRGDGTRRRMATEATPRRRRPARAASVVLPCGVGDSRPAIPVKKAGS
jgi:deazaflavin-dependent oxidoreductase (nitroreductase family)